MSRETEEITCGCSSATAGPANSRSLHNTWLLERHSGPGQLPQPPITYAPRHASTRARHRRCVRFRKTKQHFASVIWASRGKSFGLLKWVFDPRLPRQHVQRGAKLFIPRPKVFSSCMKNYGSHWIPLLVCDSLVDPISPSSGSHFFVWKSRGSHSFPGINL